jgi:Fe2+ transport system protein FeoA
MKLSELNKGDRAIIQSISSNEELKLRLYSFGVARGSKLYVEACSIGKHNLAIVVNDTVIGLRSSEASQISIKIDDT